jgi:hypothetical protein
VALEVVLDVARPESEPMTDANRPKLASSNELVDLPPANVEVGGGLVDGSERCPSRW